ncbi:MAG: amidohydrolase [Chloroflexi bacterium]|nr:amidohydrolase [Chloroflexota bacterium]
MIIDFHTHVFSPRLSEHRDKYTGDPCFAALYSSPKARLATAEELVAAMDKDGIDIAVICNIGWLTHEMCVKTNDYILESIARYPKRLTGFCSIQPNLTEKAIAEIERCARGGLKGVGELRPDTQGFDLRDENVMSPIVEAMMKHRMVLLTHTSEPVGHSYPGKGKITPDMVYPFIARFPDLPIVCAHWGGGLPFYALMPEVKRAFGNVYFDTAASPFLYNPQIYNQVIQIAGADRILFGSDYPLMPQSRVLGEIDSLGLPEETRNLILSANARKLLGI